MTAESREELLRRAGVLKMRAMRLRALGAPDEERQAIVLFHEAARAELDALATLSAAPAAEEAGARIEACGLFLEGKDPVRAAEQWVRLPRWVSTEAGAGAITRLLPFYRDQLALFAAAWRSLGVTPDTRSSLKSLRASRLRAVLEAFPGIAELWGALGARATSEGEAAAARARALELDPGLVSDEQVRSALARIEPTIERKLVLEMRGDRASTSLGLELVSRIGTAFGEVLESFFGGAFGEEIDLVPIGAARGSFILYVNALGLPPHALEWLDAELNRGPEHVGARALAELSALLQQHGVRIEVSVSCGDAGASVSEGPKLVIDAARRKALSSAAEATVLSTIDSNDVPQADDLERVFRIVDMVVRREELDAEVLAITPRQVGYYRRAAQILGLLDDSCVLTAGGRLIARLPTVEDRLRATVVHFESSSCGDAWIRWAEKQTLKGVDPESAFDFLRSRCPGLGESTAGRRAQTLEAWHRALTPHHYAG